MLVTEPEIGPIRIALLILSCRVCGRSVKVYGKVRRVLCSCGRVLMETELVSPELANTSFAGKRG